MTAEAVEQMTLGINQLGKELNLPVIDIYAATAKHPDCFAFDGVHANVGGAKLITETVFAAIRNEVSQQVRMAK
jgi:lysophospholipase L1-like esterase